MKRIIGIIILSVIVFSGCNEKSDFYYGIEKNDIGEIANAKNIEFVNQYKGHTDNWAADYIVYKMRDNENHRSRMLLKYVGKEPKPIGELSYVYNTVGGENGSGTMSNSESKSGIYNLGSGGGNGSISAKDSLVKMQVDWNGNTEKIELKSEMKR